MDLEKISQQLYLAHKQANSLTRFTAEHANFSLSDAYKVQHRLLNKHIHDGDLLVGRKMGMTSKAKMQQMGIHSPIHGFLTDSMHVLDGGSLSLKGRIHPKAEPEIAFITGKQLSGKPSLSECWNAIDSVTCALEIIDSRYTNFEFQLPDVVADNCSSSGFVLGSKKLNTCDIENLGIIFQINGKPVQFGSSAAILGNPMRSLAALVELLDQEGQTLPAGSIVLAGGATAAHSLKLGDHVLVEVQNLGSCEFKVVP